jgi:hypothetical protein
MNKKEGSDNRFSTDPGAVTCGIGNTPIIASDSSMGAKAKTLLVVPKSTPIQKLAVIKTA